MSFIIRTLALALLSLSVAGRPLLSEVGQALEARSLLKRDYQQAFVGAEPVGGPDAAIVGSGYISRTVLSESTCGIHTCLDYCDKVPSCVFVNLYYEYNTGSVDYTGTPSNLKCAAFSAAHTAAEKTNWGGQQVLPPPAGTTYMSDSAGWARI